MPSQLGDKCFPARRGAVDAVCMSSEFNVNICLRALVKAFRLILVVQAKSVYTKSNDISLDE